MFDVVRDATTGAITEIVGVKADVDLSQVSTKIQHEQESINDALKKWQEANDKLVTDKAAKYGTKVTEDLEKIGKNAGNK